MKKVEILLTIDGENIARTYGVDDSVVEVDWNEVISDMEDTINNVEERQLNYATDAKVGAI